VDLREADGIGSESCLMSDRSFAATELIKVFLETDHLEDREEDERINITMDLREADRTGSGSCPVSGCSSAATELSRRSNLWVSYGGAFLQSTVNYGVITNDMSDYINLLVRIAHIICNHPLFCGA
jgi:hypothetical protein